METAGDRRKRKLTELCKLHGVEEVAARSGLNPDALRQIMSGVLLPPKKDGTRTPRRLGDAAAAAIEDAFTLGRGWFDSEAPEPHPDPERRMPSDSEWAVLDVIRKMPPEVRDPWIADGLKRARMALDEAAKQLERFGVTGVAPNEKVAKHITPAPRPAAANVAGDRLIGGMSAFGELDDRVTRKGGQK